jgi:MOSC domain-containing protein
VLEISELYIHPLKSAASIAVEKVALDDFGLQYDRRWMLVDDSGNFLSQRQLPMMCLIKAVVEGSVLTVHVPDFSPLKVSVIKNQPRTVKVWGDACNSYDCGDEVAKYLSHFLEAACRLVYFPGDEKRQVDLAYAKKGDLTGFSDGFPLLIISQASLDDLNARLDKPVSMTRFRPNIVISGTEAFAEDEWKNIIIGGINFRIVKPCSRCSVPSVDPLTGLRSIEPVKTLRNYRMRGSKVYFGQNVIADSTGMLEVGMPVEIVK